MKKQVSGSHLRQLVLLLASAPAVAQEVAMDDVAHGELVLIGNTMGLDGAAGDEPGIDGSPYAWIRDELIDPAPQANADWGAFTTNNWEDSRSYTSFSADGRTVRRAILLWSGTCNAFYPGLLGIGSENEDNRSDVTDDMEVTLFAQNGQGSEEGFTVVADTVVNECTNSNSDFDGYTAWADITDVIPWVDGDIGVGGVVGTQVRNVDSNYAGWAIALVLEDPALPQRTFNLQVGWSETSNGSDVRNIDGLCIPENPEASRVVAVGAEGDASLVGDSLWFGNADAWDANRRALQGPNTPLDNAFASQIIDANGLPLSSGVNTTPSDHLAYHSAACIAIDPDGEDTRCLVDGARQGFDILTLPVDDDSNTQCDDGPCNPDRLDPGDTTARYASVTGGDVVGLLAFGLQAPFAYVDGAEFGGTDASPTVYVNPVTSTPGELTVVVGMENTGTATAGGLRLKQGLPASVTGLTDLSYKINDGGATRPSTSLAELKGAGVQLPDVTAGSHIEITMVLEVSSENPSTIQLAPEFSFSWEQCGSGESGTFTAGSASSSLEWCGDSTINGPETCDGSELAARTCADEGFDIGTLACDADCGGYDVTACCDDDDDDGICNEVDVCDGDDTTDSDGDTVPDDCDVCANGDDRVDGDGDGRPDDCDICPTDNPNDIDFDGVCDGIDLCIGDNSTGDTDTDGVCDDRDACEGDDATGDADEDGLCTDVEISIGTNPNDADSDDDGLSDITERQGTTDPTNPDTDGDGVQDGTELGLTVPETDDTDPNVFVPDADAGATTTDPLSTDSDGGGTPDGVEDGNRDGKIDSDECDPRDSSDDGACVDTDGDGLSDLAEISVGTEADDDDTDDDGILDGAEVTAGTDPLSTDSDGDGIQDGTERGLSEPQGNDTDLDVFIPDADAGATKTDPLRQDSDGGGAFDGAEDIDFNGKVDPDECDPTDPFDDGACSDTDGDGLTDAEEVSLGTDARDDDTDDDGIVDGAELSLGTSPRNPDSDGDGIQDGTEIGLTAPQGNDTDTDRFVPDADDTTTTDPTKPDTDGGTVRDGVEDSDRNGRVDDGECDPNLVADDAACIDTDDDGLSDAAELILKTDPNNGDTDNDGISDGREGPLGTDPLSADSDGDGLPDGLEVGLDAPDNDDTDLTAGTFRPDLDETTTTDPLKADTDGGGVDDNLEDKNGNGRFDEGECDPRDPLDDLYCIDTDGDGVSDGDELDNGTDPEDDDSDDDGVSDGHERALGTFPNNADTDGDGIPDGVEIGLTEPEGNNTDSSVFVPDADPSTTTDPLRKDSDGGGLEDGEEDVNLNGAIDGTETDPNDPTDDARDLDNDGLTDAEEAVLGTDPEDPDTDDDGLTDGEEAGIGGTGSDPLDADTDGDGASDGDEVDAGSDPLVADTDGDGVNDGDELTNGTDPTKADTDGDGLTDGQEQDLGTDPLKGDTDDDGLGDAEEVNDYGTDPVLADTDDDGLNDGEELELGTDPVLADTDAGGVNDGDEVAAGSDPLDSRDDLPGTYEGVACSSTGGGPLPWFLLLPLVPAFFRRQR